jgi:protein tyrosine/serine phosphatase
LPTDELDTIMRDRRAWWDFLLGDLAVLRLISPNVKRVGDALVTTSQPWPHQLKAWRDRGVRTVVDLRGAKDRVGGMIEDAACARLGLELVELPMKSRDVPSVAVVRRIKELAEGAEGLVLAHCKSGSDRAGLFAVLWRHFRLGEPVAVAMAELGFWRRGHFRGGKAGVLDFTLERYLAEGALNGQDFLQWVESPAYDPKAIKRGFKASWWGTLLSDRLLRRE